MPGVTVYHGTCATHWRMIERDGLVAVDGIGPFVTSDANRAAGYAVRACCVEVHARGEITLNAAPAALVVSAIVDAADLIRDPGHHGDYVLPGGVVALALSWFEFDPRPHVSDSEIASYALRAAMARGMERLRSSLWAA